MHGSGICATRAASVAAIRIEHQHLSNRMYEYARMLITAILILAKCIYAPFSVPSRKSSKIAQDLSVQFALDGFSLPLLSACHRGLI